MLTNANILIAAIGALCLSWYDSTRPVLTVFGAPEALTPFVYAGTTLYIKWDLEKHRECAGGGSAYAVGIEDGRRYLLDQFMASARAGRGEFVFQYPVHHKVEPGEYFLEAVNRYHCSRMFDSVKYITGPKFTVLAYKGEIDDEGP